MRITLYVEGGGDSIEQHSRCREGFRKLLEKAGFRGSLPKVVACGGRNQAFRDFRIAAEHLEDGHTCMLLVDSEDPVTALSKWVHVYIRDGWQQPVGTNEDQLQFMITCMESWIAADRESLKKFYGPCLKEKRLPPLADLESRNRSDIQEALQRATASCEGKAYRKGAISFQILAELNPDVLQKNLPAFQQFKADLDRLSHR